MGVALARAAKVARARDTVRKRGVVTRFYRSSPDGPKARLRRISCLVVGTPIDYRFQACHYLRDTVYALGDCAIAVAGRGVIGIGANRGAFLEGAVVFYDAQRVVLCLRCLIVVLDRFLTFTVDRLFWLLREMY